MNMKIGLHPSNGLILAVVAFVFVAAPRMEVRERQLPTPTSALRRQRLSASQCRTRISERRTDP
jgi:hypothetical protein